MQAGKIRAPPSTHEEQPDNRPLLHLSIVSAALAHAAVPSATTHGCTFTQRSAHEAPRRTNAQHTRKRTQARTYKAFSHNFNVMRASLVPLLPPSSSTQKPFYQLATPSPSPSPTPCGAHVCCNHHLLSHKIEAIPRSPLPRLDRVSVLLTVGAQSGEPHQ